MNQEILDSSFWNDRYNKQQTGWDLGTVSPPLQQYFDTIQNKNAAILIPGCGNCYEAEYLLAKGFTNITILDIAPSLVENLKIKFANNPNIQIICDDFFNHNSQYDIIFEQTFFCAIDPSLRKQYVAKMQQLLKPNAVLAGLLFSVEFEKQGPPFGGLQQAYENLFHPHFSKVKMASVTNSIESRAGQELFIVCQK